MKKLTINLFLGRKGKTKSKPKRENGNIYYTSLLKERYKSKLNKPNYK